MALGTAQQTITTGAVFLPDVWSKEVQRATQSTLVLANRVKRFDDDVADAGNLLEVPKISNLTANAKSANTQVTLNAPTETKFQLSLNRHFEASYLVEDRLKVQSKYNLLQQYAEKAGYAIGKQTDADLAGLWSGMSQTTGNSTTKITDANLLRAIQFLDDADAPQVDRTLVIKPAGLSNLRLLDKFSRFDALGIVPNPASGAGGLSNGKASIMQIGPNGFVGVVYNLEVYMSTNLVEETGTSNTVHNVVMQREGMALAIQLKPRTQFQYKQEYLGMLATTDSIWGFASYRDSFMCDFRSSNT